MRQPAEIKHRTRPIGRIALGVVLSLLLVMGLGMVWVYGKLMASLPRLDGRVALNSLQRPVIIERDALGIPTIRGRSRLDVARATGYAHAQDRFFQMDLLRRKAAGELSALFGAGALEVDRAVRIHRFRALARQGVTALPPQHRTWVEAYTEGVNAGLQGLAAPSFEYLLLGQAPVPWSPEDSLLMIYAMYLDLHEEQWPRESDRGVMNDVLPHPLYGFLNPEGTEWDAPLQGPSLTTPSPPGPEVVDLRSLSSGSWIGKPASRVPDWERLEATRGSNNWAVAGTHTEHGGALLANDMHLGLNVPNIWYRISLVYPDQEGRERRVTGVTLPGAPAVVAGSNGRIAWGYTNANGDWSDLVLLEVDQDAPNTYLTPEGSRHFYHYRETFQVKGEPDRVEDIPWTIWGPVFDRDHRGRRRALRWTAHDPAGINMELLTLETATTVDQAIAIAQGIGGPNQNFMVADSAGRIGWTIMGPIPRRFGHDGRIPRSWADGARGWDGWLLPAEYPRVVDPPQGRLWTANARVVAGEALNQLGNGGYDLGARARQIRDALFAKERFNETDMLALQLDDRALFWQRWRDLLLEILPPEVVAGDPRRRELRRQLLAWDGHAAVDAVGFRLVRAFRLVLQEQVFSPLTEACTLADPRFDYRQSKQWEGPLWRLLEERPRHLLNPRYEDWRTQLLAAVDALLDYATSEGAALEAFTWGSHNTTHIRHPMSRSLPLVGHWLDMPAIPLPGAAHMPRVQTPTHGASQRMVVTPGREAEGIFHMPVGQSGHPLSPYYRNSHDAWVAGRPSAFLPGPPEHVLTLVPADHPGD